MRIYVKDIAALVIALLLLILNVHASRYKGPFVRIEPVMQAKSVKPGDVFRVLVIIYSNSDTATHVNLRIHVDGAVFVSRGTKTSNEVLMSVTVKGHNKVVKEYVLKANSDLIVFEYNYNGWHGKGFVGDIKYPCTFIEVYTKPSQFTTGYKIEESEYNFITVMYLSAIKLQQLKLRVYNSCELKNVPISIEFPNARPSQSIVVYNCKERISESYPMDVCLSWACAVKDRTGPLRCVKWGNVDIPMCKCVKKSEGKCVEWKVLHKKVKRCLKLVSTEKCYMMKCTRWGKQIYKVKYCKWLPSSVVKSEVKIRGREASLTLKGSEALVSLYYEPNQYYYGFASSNVVKAPLVTIYVGGTPYYTIEGTLESANYRSFVTAAMVTLVTFVIALLFFYFT